MLESFSSGDSAIDQHVSMSVGQFERVAATISERTAALLSAEVTVTDAHGVVVASSAPRNVGLHYPLAAGANMPSPNMLRFPIQVDAHRGEVIVEGTADGAGLPPLAAQALIDLLIDQAATVTRLPNHYELKNKFIYDLVMGSFADTVNIPREADLLGMDFSAPRAVVLIDASDYILGSGRSTVAHNSSVEFDSGGIRHRAQHVITSVVRFFNLPDDTICGYIGNGEIAVLKASADRDMAAWMQEDDRSRSSPSWANLTALKRAGAALLSRIRADTRSSVNVGIGRYHPGLHGLSRSYQDASLALELGRRLHGDNRVHCLDSLGVAAFVGVSDARTQLDLAEHILRPLDAESELLRTLDAFFSENCSPSATAARLKIHRNTLAYRLDRITTLIDLNPRTFDDAVQIRIALLVRTFGRA